jgi:hypothetical protein
MNDNKANYISVYVANFNQIENPELLVDSVERALLVAHGYNIVGQTEQVQKWLDLDGNKLNLILKIEGIRQAKALAEREAAKIVKSYWLVPWSVGFQCFTAKPEGFSIEVVERQAYDALAEQLERKS